MTWRSVTKVGNGESLRTLIGNPCLLWVEILSTLIRACILNVPGKIREVPSAGNTDGKYISYPPVLLWSQQNYLRLLKTLRYFESSGAVAPTIVPQERQSVTGVDWAIGQSDHARGPAMQGARLAANKIIKDVLVIHSNTCSLTRVTQLHIVVCVSHICCYFYRLIHMY